MCSVFGPDPRHVAPGHEVIEMATVKPSHHGKTSTSTRQSFYWGAAIINMIHSAKKTRLKRFCTGRIINLWWSRRTKPSVMQYVLLPVRSRADVAALTDDKDFLNAIDKNLEQRSSEENLCSGGAVQALNAWRKLRALTQSLTTKPSSHCHVYWNQRMFQLHRWKQVHRHPREVVLQWLCLVVKWTANRSSHTNAWNQKIITSMPIWEAERVGWFTCSCCLRTSPADFRPFRDTCTRWKSGSIAIHQFICNQHKATSSSMQNRYHATEQLSVDGNYRSESIRHQPIHLQFASEFGLERRDKPCHPIYTRSQMHRQKIIISVNGKPIEYTIEKWLCGD